MIFDWDDANLLHIARHDVTPEEAEQVVNHSPVELEMQVVDGEERFPVLGETSQGRILRVVVVELLIGVRVVTAYDADRREKLFYLSEKGTGHARRT